ncbi:hypothetical protein BC629DRAFT_1436602 [Irpex lacteus]|nr:hypothetical protein BC629DRAFT_1436602 [Irpex lacteus]
MVNRRVLTLASVTGVIAYTSAQSISTGCQTGLAGLALNSDTGCLNLQGLLGLVTVGNSSIVDPVNTWLGGFCSQPACSNSTLATVVNTLTSDCQAEMTQLGIQNVSSAQLTTLVQQFFPLVKEIGCLKDDANNTLCATETLKGYESANGPLNVDALKALLGDVEGSSVPPTVPQSVECSSCAKQAFNIVNQQFPGVLNSDAQQNVQQTCGADFTNGQTPSGISSSANNAVQGSSNSTASGAIMAYVPGAALSMVLTVASLFTIGA